MRKLSKSRGDDDMISSTNGSLNEDQEVTEQSASDKPEDIAPELEDNDEVGHEHEDTLDIPKSDPIKKKKKTAKNKSKKRKTEKEDSKDEEEYEVEKVVDSKKIKGKLHYLIRWKGYSADSDTWEPENTLSCPDLISKYNDEKENSKNKESNSSSKKKRGLKRKSKNETKVVAKRSKNNEWDSKSADANAEYEVDRILEVHHKKNGKREFLIHWKGWSSKFDSWEPENNLNCPDLIKRFMEKVDAARSVENRSLRPAPEATHRFTLQAPTTGRRLSKRRGQRQRVRYDNAE